MNAKSTASLGCDFNLSWEFHRTSYTDFDEEIDAEKVTYLSKKLVELQNSDGPFKDSVIDFIDLLKRGFGNINASHHNNVLSVDLGYSNAQCQCYECVGLASQENLFSQYSTNLFSYDENAQFM